MELVAAAKLRRAQERIEAMRPYADRMVELMGGVSRAASSVRSIPLLQRREDPQRVAVVPITGDRGLAGAFNSQVLRRAFALERDLRAEGLEVRWLVSGKKGRSTLSFRRYELMQSWTGFSDQPAYGDAQAIAHTLADLYVNGEIDRAIVIYNAFVSPLVQRVTVQDVLPVPEELLQGEEDGGARTRRCAATSSTSPSPSRSSSGSSPSTSRRRSTGRCSSRPRPSRGRA